MDASSSCDLPLAVLVIGMAGAGKTSMVQRLVAHLAQHKTPRYVVNLDPAVQDLKYPVNVDIRSSVNYKQVMRDYNLGPNGAIVTSLNLFATQFDTVVKLCEAKKDQVKYIIVDTPGQIEVFTWSSSGTIITESLAVTFPTVVLYVVDTTRCENTATFMSNMLYACSILYKTRLPFVLCFNKCDAGSSATAQEWMKDWDTLHDVLAQENTYMSNLTRSLSMVLQSFYSTLRCVPCSAATGSGIDELLSALNASRAEYDTDYKPQLLARIQRRKEKKAAADEFDDEVFEGGEDDDEDNWDVDDVEEKEEVTDGKL